MKRIRIICLEDEREDVVAALHRLGSLDLRKSELNLGDAAPPENSPAISDLLIKFEGAIQSLPKAMVKPEKHLSGWRLIRYAGSKSKATERIYSLKDSAKVVLEEQSALGYAIYVSSLFEGTGINFSSLKSNALNYKAYVSKKKRGGIFLKALDLLKVENEVITKNLPKGEALVFVAYDAKKGIDDANKLAKMTELDLHVKFLEGSPSSVIKKATEAKNSNAKKLEQISKELESIAKKDYSSLANITEMLQIEFARCESASFFKKTEKTSIIEGWIPVKRENDLKMALQKATSGRYYLEDVQTEELAPTYLNRPGILKPFDYLVNFYSTPRSDEIDPTWIFIVSFPIFYGLMVSDVGYGIGSLLLSTWITRRTDPEGLMYNAARIWQINAVAAMVFGVLSNQWFGFQLNGYVGLHSAFDWLKNTPALIAITVLFGVVQVVLGLSIGVYNSYNHGHKKMAYARLASILVVIFGTIAVAGAFFGAFNGTITEISGIISIISLLATAVLSGSEATEITNLITHPLSYARLMGFGLGSVIIAFLINMAFTPHLGTGVFGIILFVVFLVIFIALHFLNMILSMFEGIVQGVRLNFVEFFSKFYIGNGVQFKPFRYKRVNTKENGE